jgi:hypothetical protein
MELSNADDNSPNGIILVRDMSKFKKKNEKKDEKTDTWLEAVATYDVRWILGARRDSF